MHRLTGVGKQLALARRQLGLQARQNLRGLELLKIEYRQFNGINRVLYQEAKFGIAFHRQTTTEEQGVGVLLTCLLYTSDAADE